jgi:RNA polymerase sigma-70 factor (ECF subfamily)
MTRGDKNHPVRKPVPDDERTREDELLAIRCQLGERDAFDELIRRWNDPLWGYLRRMAGNDDAAADLLQETWLRVVRGLSRLRDAARLRAWLFGIARRTAMDRLRLRYTTPVVADVDVQEVASAGSDDDLEADLIAMHDELARLPVTEREVLTLFYLQELSLTDVADVLGVPVGTVKSRLFRARRMLRAELTSRGDRT